MISFGIGPGEHHDKLRSRMHDFMSQEDEFLATRAAMPPRRKRRLLGAIRGGAGSYGWADPVYRQVTNLLYETHVLSREELAWLQTVGPAGVPRLPNT